MLLTAESWYELSWARLSRVVALLLVLLWRAAAASWVKLICCLTSCCACCWIKYVCILLTSRARLNRLVLFFYHFIGIGMFFTRHFTRFQDMTLMLLQTMTIMSYEFEHFVYTSIYCMYEYILYIRVYTVFTPHTVYSVYTQPHM